MSSEACTMHLFPLFPPEIRNEIWRFAALVPRRVIMGHHNIHNIYRDDEYLYYRHQQSQSDANSSLALLLVNKEAHSLFKSIHELLYETPPGGDKRRIGYINPSTDTLCLVGIVYDWAFHPRKIDTRWHVTGLKFLEIDHGSLSPAELLWISTDSHSTTNLAWMARAIPDIRSHVNSLETVVVRPRWLGLHLPKEAKSSLEDLVEEFTTTNLGYDHNDNTLFMLEALAHVFGVGKPTTPYLGPTLV